MSQRQLSVTDPVTRGEDVADLIHAANRLSGSKTGYGLHGYLHGDAFTRPVLVRLRGAQHDAQSRAESIGYLLGLPDAQLSGPLRPYAQARILDPSRRTAREKARGKRRYIARRLALRAAAAPGTERARLAREILAHPNAIFAFSSPTGGTARVGLEAAARGDRSYVAATGEYVDIDIHILRFLRALCNHGSTFINCVTNGRHRPGSKHYSGYAADIDKGSQSDSHIRTVGRTADVGVLDEDRYHWHVYVGGSP